MTIKAAVAQFTKRHGYAPTIMQVVQLTGQPYHHVSEAIAGMVKTGELGRFKRKVWVTKRW